MLSSSDADEDQVGPTFATTGAAVGAGETFVGVIIRVFGFRSWPPKNMVRVRDA